MIRAFLLGMWEFRSGVTTGFDTGQADRYADLYEAYDRGRDLAHRLTLRRWE